MSKNWVIVQNQWEINEIKNSTGESFYQGSDQTILFALRYMPYDKDVTWTLDQDTEQSHTSYILEYLTKLLFVISIQFKFAWRIFLVVNFLTRLFKFDTKCKNFEQATKLLKNIKYKHIH